MNNTYEVKVSVPKDTATTAAEKKFTAKVFRGILAETPLKAVLAKLTTKELSSTNFFRKGQNSDGKPFTMYEGIFKSAPTKRMILVTETVTAKPEAAASKSSTPRAARSTTPKAPDNRGRCQLVVWYAGDWAQCTRKEGVEGQERCFQHLGKEQADMTTKGTPVVPEGKFAGQAPAVPLDPPSDINEVKKAAGVDDVVAEVTAKAAKKPTTTKVKGKEVTPNFKSPKRASRKSGAAVASV